MPVDTKVTRAHPNPSSWPSSLLCTTSSIMKAALRGKLTSWSRTSFSYYYMAHFTACLLFTFALLLANIHDTGSIKEIGNVKHILCVVNGVCRTIFDCISVTLKCYQCIDREPPGSSLDSRFLAVIPTNPDCARNPGEEYLNGTQQRLFIIVWRSCFVQYIV